MTYRMSADRWHGPSAGWAGTLEVAFLAPLSAVLVLGVIPALFSIEWECSIGYGVVRTAGDEYLSAFAVVGAVGWLAVLVGMLFAQIREQRELGLLLPLAWFVVIVLASVVAAATIGPAPCAA
jgi:hypothetical protein